MDSLPKHRPHEHERVKFSFLVYFVKLNNMLTSQPFDDILSVIRDHTSVVTQASCKLAGRVNQQGLSEKKGLG